MKKFDLRILYLIISISGLLLHNSANAQNARTQWINNSAATALDTIDIYMDGTKIADNLLFKSATSVLSSTSGSHTININEASSADSGDLVISRNSINFTSNSNNTVMVAGVDVPSSYAANPNGRTTAVQLISKSGILVTTTSSSNCALALFFGVTDNEGVNINTRPTGAGITFTKSKFGDATASVTPSATSILLDIMDTTGTIIKTLVLPLNNFSKKSITIFNAGFVTPSTNQNGELEAFYLVDTNGGPATKISEISRVQFINNSADLILDTVDVWLNNTKVANKLAYTAATNTFTVNKGNYDITITKKNSPDTTGSNVVYEFLLLISNQEEHI